MTKVISEYKLEHKTSGSAGYDIKNTGDEVLIEPWKTATFPTGVKAQVSIGEEIKVRGRSGLWFNDSISIGQEGTIDSDYTGEIKVKLINLSDIPCVIKKGDRIAQLIFGKYISPEFEYVDKLDKTDRGEGGFGHTGK